MRIQESPLFIDPIYAGTADPTIIWNHIENEWWIVYTQRMASIPGPAVTGVHGSELGVASSKDGSDWVYRGTLEGLHFEHGHNTFWAPEIIFRNGVYHMYVSYVRGMPTNWNHPREIIHYTSLNLWEWKFESILPLSSHKVIDACVAEIRPGYFRMWYKDEADNSYSHYSDSTDLYNWFGGERAIADESHEGPNVFFFEGKWWYIGDYWKGLKCFSSSDCLNWKAEGIILKDPGSKPYDNNLGNHADVLIAGKEAYIFYFSSLKRPEGYRPGMTVDPEYKKLAVQVRRLTADDSGMHCDRDEDFDFVLPDGPSILPEFR